MLLHEGSSIDVGIDIGKRRIAYSWPYWGIVDYMDLGKPGMRRDAELRLMRDWVATKLPDGVQIWIDKPLSHGSGVGTVAAGGMNQTVSMVLSARAWTHEPIEVYSSTWKAQVVGNHAAAKDDLRDWLIENYPALAAVCRTEDECDATIVALYGKGRSDGEILPPDVRRPKRRSVKKA
jgi:hypothetical protein